jgi:hypothetical protein
VGAAGEKTEHAGGVGCVFGLAEDLVVEGYGGVGAEDGYGLGSEAIGATTVLKPGTTLWRQTLGALAGVFDFGEDGFGFFAGETD